MLISDNATLKLTFSRSIVESSVGKTDERGLNPVNNANGRHLSNVNMLLNSKNKSHVKYIGVIIKHIRPTNAPKENHPRIKRRNR